MVNATCKEEREKWGKNTLDTSIEEDANHLVTTLKEHRRRRNWRSSAMYFESDRTIRKVDAYKFTWDVVDPDEEKIGWTTTFGGLKNRWKDTLHSIFRKVQSHKDGIASRAIKLRNDGKESMSLHFEDPLEPLKIAFRQLLAPKELLEANLREQTLYYMLDDKKLNISTLSSGEREVINVVFDFILRKPRACYYTWY